MTLPAGLTGNVCALVFSLAIALPLGFGAGTAQAADTGVYAPLSADEDLDGDGYSFAEGDCLDDPNDPDSVTVHPGAVELCEDLLDNDCNGLFNDGCESPLAYGSVQGGGCTAVGLWPAAPLTVFFAFVLGTLRRRRGA